MSYIPPEGNDANFEIQPYTPPEGDQADFNLTGSETTDRSSEIHGIDNFENERSSEIVGAATGDDRSSEIYGGNPVNDERSSQIEGVGTPTERSSEVYGSDPVSSERTSQIFGKAFVPLKRRYRILVKDENGEFIGEFDAYKRLTFGKRLNNYGECQFDILATDPKVQSLISLRKYTVWIYIQENAGQTLVWAGEQAARIGDLNNEGNNWCTIICFTWLEQLNSRFTVFEVEYEQEDGGEIAWDLIDKTQNGWDGYGYEEPYGDFGIVRGTIETTVNRDKTFINQNIMEAIIGLSDVQDGFDFEITDEEKEFNVYVVKGEDKTDEIVLEYGENVDSVKVIEDFTHPSNRAIVLGEVIGEETLQRIERNDTSSQSEYLLRESMTSENEASELENFQDRGDAINQKYGQPLSKLDIKVSKGSNPSITEFDVGDTVLVKIVSGIYDIKEDYRVFEWQVEVDSNDAEQLSLVLGKFTLV